MLYKLISGQDPFELNPGLRAAEKYNKLTARQLYFVLVLCDPSRDNPLRTLSGKYRRERAAVLAGYKMEADGKRLDKNGREVVDGKVASIEEAIEDYKKNNYSEKEKNKEALRKQIAEIREFLIQDKVLPLTGKSGIIKDEKGKEIWVTDQKALKLAAELGKDLPDLEEALDRLQASDIVDTKYEGLTYTSNDIPQEEENSDKQLSTIERVLLSQNKND